ncbi:MAG: membrane or secreted protein [bacterium]|jgi:hypothetical protein
MIKVFRSSLVILLSLLLTCSVGAQQINGAWTRSLDTAVQYLTIVDYYYSLVTFNVESKKFINTTGGTLDLSNGRISGAIEFNTADKSAVGSKYDLPVHQKGKKLQLDLDGIGLVWNRVDMAEEGLSGNWKIIGREQDGKMGTIVPGARKTIKILSATRFQWVALNSATGEFFGTGGGTYTFNNGKYTEKIEFFSRDASRVGASLSFDAELKDGDWHHSGLSSKGDRIYEVWSRK